MKYSWATLRRMAREALDGVGDPALGEWEETGDRAFHLRRRLMSVEADSIGPVVDVRHTPEAQHRFHAMQRFLPAGWTEIQ